MTFIEYFLFDILDFLKQSLFIHLLIIILDILTIEFQNIN